MTKRHFEKIASTIKEKLGEAGEAEEWVAIRETARALADDFKSFNPRFDRERFLAACGL